MTEQEAKDELRKCQEDPVYFFEKYYTINGKPVKLTEWQKEMIRNPQEYARYYQQPRKRRG
jgi:spore cortex formation protein SpoVR/YcgB (stage V sporulation)